MKIITEISNWQANECREFLKNTYGMRGYNGTGITLKEENRTLENMRYECRVQFLISRIEDLLTKKISEWVNENNLNIEHLSPDSINLIDALTRRFIIHYTHTVN